jgi:putative CocE/NonD family hydrolase
MRDGIRVAIDVYRPDAPGKFPVLYASSCYMKDLVYLPPVTTYHNRETNDINWFVQRGYVYVNADVRGTGKSEGIWKFHSEAEQKDHYDLIEWMANNLVDRPSGYDWRVLLWVDSMVRCDPTAPSSCYDRPF